jgi:mRNA-degrading endonuclease RelE of RelBE toxin-antitoxin system
MTWPVTRIPRKRSTRAEYHRLRVGQYRVFYRVGGDVVTIEHVDRVR